VPHKHRHLRNSNTSRPGRKRRWRTSTAVGKGIEQALVPHKHRHLRNSNTVLLGRV